MATLVCSSCGREFSAADGAVVSGASCPDCQQRSMQDSSPPPIPKQDHSHVCGICFTPIKDGETTTECPSCRAAYHDECWRENKGCAVYGCPGTPQVEPRTSVEIPVSFWGQEKKPCPACGREILAAAIRCRFCGATFVSAQPEDASSFNQRSEREKRLPVVRHTTVWIFVLSAIPCTAPIGGLWGLVWFSTHRSDVEALPLLYTALCKIGIAVGLGQTVLMILMTIIYAAMHHG